MIPGASLFSHLMCGFGSQCDRPYCFYLHTESCVNDQSPPAKRQLQQQSTDSAQKNLAYSQKVHEPKTSTSANQSKTGSTSFEIVQENDASYVDFAYRGFVASSDHALATDFPIYESFPTSEYTQLNDNTLSEFQPVLPEYVPKPVSTRKQEVKSKKTYDYSILNSKPSIPVDLGNDEILLGLSAARSSGKSVVKSFRPEISSSTETTRNKQRHAKGELIPSLTTFTSKHAKPSASTSRQNQDLVSLSSLSKNLRLRTKSKSTTIESKMTAATNSFIASLREEKLTDQFESELNKHSAATTVQSSRIAQTRPSNFKDTSGRSSQSVFDEAMSIKKELDKWQINSMKDTISSSLKKNKIDAEQELREIELLERKMRLLKEYKRLAQEIVDMESKQKPGTSQQLESILDDDSEATSSAFEPLPKAAKLAQIEKQPLIKSPIKISDFQKSTVASAALIKASVDSQLQSAIQAVRTTLASSSMMPSTLTTTASKSSYRDQMIKRYPSSKSSSNAKWSLNTKTKPELTPATSSKKCDSNKDSRVAHSAKAFQLIPLNRFANKIPYNQRCRSLQKLHEEFCKHSEIAVEQAVEMSLAEEKLLHDRAQTSIGYASALAGAVRGIRNKQFTLPTLNNQGEMKATMSITERMAKERKGGEKSLTEERFYMALHKKYLMSTEQLRDNGYPYVVKGEDGNNRVKIESGNQRKLFVENNDFRRTCCRCGAEYELKPNGEFVKPADCVFHWKRAFKRRINKTMETRYGCCDSDLTVKGCVVQTSHVNQVMRQSELKTFVRTPLPTGSDDHRSRKVYALDCEMVYTTWGISLARLTIVDWQDNMVLDVLVKPSEAILDCNTKFSGLTNDMLEKAECDLREAQNRLFKFVNSETILIGHSLESDLRALRLVHRRVVDTSVVYPHRLGPPMKRALRNLASEYLQKIIQEDVEGHDSKEDSSTCLQLMLLKVRTEMGI